MQGEPCIPKTITVHLGKPGDNAENVTVSFADYVKNVASSEIYPTWPENAIRANIYVIVTYVLNRYYTEWYRSRGYDFDITNSTQYDQSFVYGRDIFEPISVIVDELFNDYLRRPGSIEPMFAAFCNGTTTTCDGLSQWGTVDLANQGMTPFEILTHFYGDNLEIVRNAPICGETGTSFAGIPLELGMASNDVRTVQVKLNRISRDYPAIPKIYPVDGIYGLQTEAAVKKFQEIFNLPQTGIVDKATWYKINYIFTSVKHLAELNSEGLNLEEIRKQYTPDALKKGITSNEIKTLQYYLAVIGAYYADVLPVDITGYFGDMTENSVRSFQQVFGLPETGVVDARTWRDIYRAYAGIAESVPPEGVPGGIALYPGFILEEGMQNDSVRILQEYLSYLHETYPEIPAVNNTGFFGPLTRNAVIAFQEFVGIPAIGKVGAATWNALASMYSDLKFGYTKTPGQNPGYIIS